MFGISTGRPATLLTFWTWRYLLVLVGSLGLLAILAGVWLRSNAYDQAYQMMEFHGNQISDQMTQMMEANGSFDKIKPYRELRNIKYVVQAFDDKGEEIWYLKDKTTELPPEVRQLSSKNAMVLQGRPVHEELVQDEQDWLRVGVPVTWSSDHQISLYLLLPVEEAIPTVNRQYGLMMVLISGVGLAGWFVIYFLSRKLTAPMRQLATAAQQIAEGGYDPDLPTGVKEQELQQLVSSFRHMASRLQQLEQMRTDLLAGVSHELRTPITSIRGMIQAVQSHVVTDEEADEFLQISLDESKRLQGMVEQLLHVSAIETGAQQFTKETVNLTSLVEDVIAQLSVLPAFATVEFVRDFDRSPLWVHGDAGALRQILLNLLNNSQRARPSVDTPMTIRLTASVDDHQMFLEIADSGTGIPEEDQPYIFERFYRGPDRTTRNHGLGLGLTLSRLLARAQEGDLSLVSSSILGTTFRLTLPLPDQKASDH